VMRLLAAQPKNLGSIAGRDTIVFSSLKCPDWLWVPSSLLLNVYQGAFHKVESGPDVKLTINLHLVSDLRMVGVIPPLPHMPLWRS
jgi:hypothetical protein